MTHQCDYIADGMRCHYPGTWSESTNGGGRWYCTAHASGMSQALAAEVVKQSYGYDPAAVAKRRLAEEEAVRERWLEGHGLGREPFESAHEYAVRLRAHLQGYTPKIKRMP